MCYKMIEMVGPRDLKIILTNDDGFQAPGLRALHRCLQDFGNIYIVAPEIPQSGIGHTVTTRSPIGVDEIEKDRFSVRGSPADCTRIALKVICPDADWVISGINPGANLGSDVYQSGTVAAAREAAILGRKAIGVSQYIGKDHQIDWDMTKYHAEPVLKMLLGKNLTYGAFWNVNLPHPLRQDADLEYVYCELDKNPHAYEYIKDGRDYIYKGTIHERPREPGKDVDVCFGGKVSITCISI